MSKTRSGLCYKEDDIKDAKDTMAELKVQELLQMLIEDRTKREVEIAEERERGEKEFEAERRRRDDEREVKERESQKGEKKLEREAKKRRRKRSEGTRKPEETGPDAGLHGQPCETGGENGKTAQSIARSRDYSEASSVE